MVSISIYNDRNQYIGSEYASNMAEAIKSAIITASTRASAQNADQFLRDCLGGLRAEVRFRDGKVIIKRT